MTKDYFKFKELLENEAEEKPSRAQQGRVADSVNSNFEKAIKEAEIRSEKAGAPNFIVYQHRTRVSEFAIKASTEEMDLEQWRTIGDAVNGKFSRDHSPNTTAVNTSNESVNHARHQPKVSMVHRQRTRIDDHERTDDKDRAQGNIDHRKEKDKKSIPMSKFMVKAKKHAVQNPAKESDPTRKPQKTTPQILAKLQHMLGAHHNQLDKLRDKIIVHPDEPAIGEQ